MAEFCVLSLQRKLSHIRQLKWQLMQETCKQEVQELSSKLMDCQTERDGYALRMEQLAPNDAVENAEARATNHGILQRHLQRISELETEVIRLRKVGTHALIRASVSPTYMLFPADILGSAQGNLGQHRRSLKSR